MKIFIGLTSMCLMAFSMMAYSQVIVVQRYPDPICRAYVTNMEVLIKYRGKGQAMLAYMSGAGSTPQSQSTMDFDKLALSRIQTGKYTPQQLEEWAYQYCESASTTSKSSSASPSDAPQKPALGNVTCDEVAATTLNIAWDDLNYAEREPPYTNVVYTLTPSSKAAEILIYYLQSSATIISEHFRGSEWDRINAEINNQQLPEPTRSQVETKFITKMYVYTKSYLQQDCATTLKEALALQATYLKQVNSDSGN